MAYLDGLLQQYGGKSRFRVIVTDGVFSMDGEIAHLKEICDLAQKYDALVFVDDCHATGILGLSGRGTPELFGVQVDFLNSTLGKALGGAAGGFTVSNHASAIKILRNKSRPYLFSNTLAPSLVGIGIKAFDLLLANPFEDARAYQARIKLFENTQFVRYTLDKAGFILKGSNHPIIPIMIGDAKLAKLFAENLFEKRGILAVPFSFPVVPNGQARIRLQISAGHPKRDLEMAVDAIISEGKALQIIK